MSTAGGSTTTGGKPEGRAEALKLIGGLVAVAIGVAALAVIACIGMGFVKTDNPSVVSIATGSFGVIGTIVGAYFGVKIGTDNTKNALDATKEAVDSMKDESAKAQAFASHMDPDAAAKAVATYQQLR
jgi:hypothetical protein